MIREALLKQQHSLKASADKFVQPKDPRMQKHWDIQNEIYKLPDLM